MGEEVRRLRGEREIPSSEQITMKNEDWRRMEKN